MNKSLLLYFSILFYFFTAFSAFADTGGILNGYHTTKVCHDSTCTTPTPGTLNFRPTGATVVVIDDALGLSGDVWGNELGWITLNPTGEGVFIEDVSTGNLIGKAWSQVSGWINFEPTGEGVTIDPGTGEFSGWAWTGGPYGGWIKFNCSDGTTCIKTDWRGTPSGNGGTIIASGSYGGDMCKNIESFQRTIPYGYKINTKGECVKALDYCPNIEGEQDVIPFGFVVNSIGACAQEVDHCPNIEGEQDSIPKGSVIDQKGDCVYTEDKCISGNITCSQKDICLNLPGVQENVPDEYIMVNDSCVLAFLLDICPNVEGSQPEVPNGMTVNINGICVSSPADVCSNLSGTQETIPLGFYLEEDKCFLSEKDEGTSEEVVAFSFVPENSRILTENESLKKIISFLGFNTTSSFKVDLVSVGVSTISFMLFVYLGFLLIRITLR